MTNLMSVVAAFALFSCDQPSKVPSANDSSANGKSSAYNKAPDPGSVTNPAGTDSTIYVQFAKDSISATAAGFIKDHQHPVTAYIEVTRGTLLEAVLQTADAKANLRITQLIKPGGQADGPFGKDLHYPVIEKGLYKLIIGNNMMAEAPWKGKFTLRVTVQ